MEIYKLSKELKELEEEIKEQRINFESMIKPKEKEYKAKYEKVRKYLKEALNECDYYYMYVKVEATKTCHRTTDGKMDIIYPFIEIKDIYVMEDEEFVIEVIEKGCERIYHNYILRNRGNGKKIEIKEESILDLCIDWVSYRIRIEKMEFEITRDYYNREKALKEVNYKKFYEIS